MIVFGQSDCIRTKGVVFEQCSFNWVKMVGFGQKWLYLGKSCFIRAKRLYSDKSGCNRAK